METGALVVLIPETVELDWHPILICLSIPRHQVRHSGFDSLCGCSCRHDEVCLPHVCFGIVIVQRICHGSKCAQVWHCFVQSAPFGQFNCEDGTIFRIEHSFEYFVVCLVHAT